MKSNELLTVGELAKIMNITVRTLQYYDKEGLLTPSSKSEGGRRLYTKKDVVKLHQILSFKYLGFSLEDIKHKLISLDDPNDVVNILNSQEKSLNSQISKLQKAVNAIQSLRDEVKQSHDVDFNKYANIISMIQQENEGYWVIKFFDDNLLTHARDKFSIKPEIARALFNKWQGLCDDISSLSEQNISPESEEGQDLAKQWWTLVMDFTEGDLSMLPELVAFNETKEFWTEEMMKKQKAADNFIGKALEIYFQNNSINNPLKGGLK